MAWASCPSRRRCSASLAVCLGALVGLCVLLLPVARAQGAEVNRRALHLVSFGYGFNQRCNVSTG
jgi:hypothetical protein